MPAKQNTKTKTKKTASKKKTVVKKAVKKAIPIKKKRIVKKKDPQLSSYKPKKNEKYMSAAMKRHFKACLLYTSPSPRDLH